MRRVWGWLSFRNAATVIASVVVALVGFVVIDASRARDEALDARNRTEATASRQIYRLQGQIGELNEAGASNAWRIGELQAQIDVLQRQIEEGGDEPAVPRTTTTTRPPTTSPPQTTTTVPPPTTTTTTTPPCEGISVFDRCVGPNQRRNQ